VLALVHELLPERLVGDGDGVVGARHLRADDVGSTPLFLFLFQSEKSKFVLFENLSPSPLCTSSTSCPCLCSYFQKCLSLFFTT
jgi:hypothetical protein